MSRVGAVRERGDVLVAGRLEQCQRFGLLVSGRQSHSLVADPTGVRFEFCKQGPTDAVAAGCLVEVDAADFGGLGVECLQAAAADGSIVDVGDEPDTAWRAQFGGLDALRSGRVPAAIARRDVGEEGFLESY